MNKKEIAEIKKLFKKDDNGITRICGCYVDAEKNKRLELREAFYSLPEEEMFKYVEIFRKTLSGTLGKNLMNMEFPSEEETSEEGKQKFLMELLKSRLENNELLDKFYDMVIQTYGYDGNYFIILIHDAYDIPSVTADGNTILGDSDNGLPAIDASDYVYDFILCSICPVKLSKAGLCYNPEKTVLRTVCGTGWCSRRKMDFYFPPLTTGIPTYITFSILQEMQTIRISIFLMTCWAALSPSRQGNSGRHSPPLLKNPLVLPAIMRW